MTKVLTNIPAADLDVLKAALAILKGIDAHSIHHAGCEVRAIIAATSGLGEVIETANVYSASNR